MNSASNAVWFVEEAFGYVCFGVCVLAVWLYVLKKNNPKAAAEASDAKMLFVVAAWPVVLVILILHWLSSFMGYMLIGSQKKRGHH